MRTKRTLALILTWVMMLLSVINVQAEWDNDYDYDDCHHYWAYEIWYEPTCTEYGKQEKFCLNCRASEMEYPAPLGHLFEDKYPESVPTCESDGSVYQECVRCGVGQSYRIPALGHIESTPQITRAATCTEPGVEYVYCERRCGKDEYRAIPATGHSYSQSKVVEEATCEKQGKKVATCQNCKKEITEVIPMKPHTVGEYHVVKAARGNAKGVEEATCTVCGQKDIREFYPEGTLKKGDKGDAVKKLQEKLNAKGFDCGTADGAYGNKTAAAVKNYQESKGQEGDGIAWPYVIQSLDMSLEIVSVDNGKAEYKSGETICVNLLCKNESTVPLQDMYGYAYIQNGAGEMLGTEMEMTVDEYASWSEVTLDPDYTVMCSFTFKAEEADGTAGPFTYVFKVTGSAQDGSAVSSNECYYDLLINNDLEGSEEAPVEYYGAVETSIHDYSDQVAVVDGTVELTFDVTNTGNAAIYVGSENLCYDATEYAPIDSHIIVEGNSLLAPGEKFTTTITTSVTAKDIEAGAVKREYFCGAYMVIGADGKFEITDNEWTPYGDPFLSNISYAEIPINAIMDGVIDPEIVDGGDTDGEDTDEGDTDSWTNEEHLVSLYKEVISTPADPSGYAVGEEIEYQLTMTNESEIELWNVIACDLLNGKDDIQVDCVYNMAPHEVSVSSFKYVVQPEDAEAGYVTNTAFTLWTVPEPRGRHSADSNTVTVPVRPIIGIEEEDENSEKTVSVSKYISSMPVNGQYYQEGEVVDFGIIIKNTTGHEIINVIVMDSLMIDETDGELYSFDMLEPGEEQVVTLAHTVSELECYMGGIFNVAEVISTNPDTQEKSSVVSNSVYAPTGISSNYELPGLYCKKEEISSPKNGEFYQQGETIEYTITVINNGTVDFDSVEVYDSLEKGNNGLIGHNIGFAKDTENHWEINYKHKVTAEDVQKGYVTNSAFAVGEYDHCSYGAVSAPVISMVGKVLTKEEIDIIRKDPGKLTLAGAGNCCSRSLDAKGSDTAEYTRHTCDIHGVTAEKAKELESTAADAAAWDKIAELWKKDIDTMYQYCEDAAENENAKMTVVKEKAYYYQQLDAYKAALRLAVTEEEAAKQVAKILENRCMDFCYELNTAQSDRVDSYLKEYKVIETTSDAENCTERILSEENRDLRYAEELCEIHEVTDQLLIDLLKTAKDEADYIAGFQLAQKSWQTAYEGDTNARYLAAFGADRNKIAAESLYFEQWIEARSDFLALLYPDKPAIAEEVLAKEIMNRVTGNCR